LGIIEYFWYEKYGMTSHIIQDGGQWRFALSEYLLARLSNPTNGAIRASLLMAPRTKVDNDVSGAMHYGWKALLPGSRGITIAHKLRR